MFFFKPEVWIFCFPLLAMTVITQTDNAFMVPWVPHHNPTATLSFQLLPCQLWKTNLCWVTLNASEREIDQI